MSSSFIDLDNYNGTPFNLYQNLNVTNNDKFNKLTGTLTKSQLSELYFSQTNIDYLQDEIISRIYRLSNNNDKISKQSEDELLIIMKSIYLQHGKNNNDNLNNQIDILNEQVLHYCIPNIQSNIKQYLGYIKDITSEKQIFEKPQFVNIKGEKALMPKHFF